MNFQTAHAFNLQGSVAFAEAAAPFKIASKAVLLCYNERKKVLKVPGNQATTDLDFLREKFCKSSILSRIL